MTTEFKVKANGRSGKVLLDTFPIGEDEPVVVFFDDGSVDVYSMKAVNVESGVGKKIS